MNRRNFLHPRRLAHAAGQAAGLLDELTPAEAAAPIRDAALVRYSRRAMATSFEVLLPFGMPAARAAAEAALDAIDTLEDQLTVYREQSEISRLNRRAYRETVAVEANLFELLTLAQRISAATDGAFDITAGALVKAWGFVRGPRRVPPEAVLAEVLQRIGMKYVALDGEQRAVRFLCSGLEINLGSIGKGYALDRAARLLQSQWKVSSALLHGGHSSVYAIGSQPGEARGWPVGISHPWRAASRLAIVWLRDRALGTSAASFQHLEWQGRKLGHILDPRTGWPAEGMASASALAPTAAEADALATAFFILGVEKARQYCEAHPGIGAILLPEGPDRQPVVCGIPPAEYSLEVI